ncbi:MAG TPA: choice-of-anchor Q domain-containing protein [Solirubrobacterales bacterium]|jgi:hypothetical protein
MKGIGGRAAEKFALLGACALLLVVATPAAAETFTVSNGGDSGAGSLRQAITGAETNANDPTIDQVQINFAGNIDLLSQLPPIDTPMSITGPGVNNLNVRRSPTAGMTQFRLFAFDPGAPATVAVQGMTISGARATGFAGGAMLKDGTGSLVLNSVWITDSQTPTGSGGALQCLDGSTSIRNSTLSANVAGFGGGFAATSSCTADLSNVTAAGNFANEFGGGIYISGSSHITVNSSTIVDNKADADDMTGGGGGGSYNASGGTAPTFSVANTLYAGNTVGTAGAADQTQCGGGDHTSSGYNLRTVDDSGCTGFEDTTDIVDANPLLGALMVNVIGPPTVALQVGSPAINKGNPATPGDAYPACPPVDERALPRGAFGNRCDIGAFEVQRNTTTTAVDCAPASLTLGTGNSTCTATVTDSGSSFPVSPPTGTLSFNSGGAGAFDPTSCPLTMLSSSEASCEVTYTPTAAGSGSHVITGAYGGDADHGSSQGSVEVGVVSPPAPPSPPAAAKTGKRAAALKKCKKKPKGPKRKKCVKRAKRLPV